MDNIKVEELCRTCMTEDLNLSSIYDYPDRELYVHTQSRIVDILAMTIPKLLTHPATALTRGICHECVTKLLSFHDFQEMCLESEYRLQLMLAHVNDKKEISVSTDPLRNSENAMGNVTTIENGMSKQKCCKEQRGQEESQVEAKAGVKIDPSSPVLREGNCSGRATNCPETPKGIAPKRKDSKRFSCTLCGKVFNSSSGLKRHENVDHDRLPKYKYYDCSACEMKFTSPYSARRHEQKLHNLKTAGGVGLAQSGTKEHKCEYCDKAYRTRTSLKTHMRCHTGEVTHLCPYCGKGFHGSGNLSQHLRRHLTEKVYECSECPKQFTTLGGLTRHTFTHSKERSFVCDICGKGFNLRDNLNKHRRYHTGERPFKCAYCDKRFAFSDKMRRHMLTHTGEKPHSCNYCDRAFAQRNDLIKHLRVHLGDQIYQCELCPRSFPTYNEMREHFTQHKRDDPETRKKNLTAKKASQKQLFSIKIQENSIKSDKIIGIE